METDERGRKASLGIALIMAGLAVALGGTAVLVALSTTHVVVVDCGWLGIVPFGAVWAGGFAIAEVGTYRLVGVVFPENARLQWVLTTVGGMIYVMSGRPAVLYVGIWAYFAFGGSC